MFRRPILLLVLILIAAVIGGLLVLAAFPPEVTPTPVERTIPNDRFGPR
ncbi:hypothetical protein ACFOD4_02635 [Pseudoroseomonas globiformis]|uniref:Uncharacterized protein n=1 Tax=Teichococcus globiformis TaxID=2307229 RepID=A0ABV7FUR9_9PROT